MPQKQQGKRQIAFFLANEIYSKVKEYVDENGMTLSGFYTILTKRELARAAKKEEE